MHKHVALTAALLMGVGISAGALAAGTDTQKCGSKQGKALATALASIFKESARACGKEEAGGAASTPNTRHATAAKIAGSFDSKVGLNVDKYNVDVDADLDFDDVGDVDNCPFDIGVLGGDDVAVANQQFADLACSPTS